MGRPDLHPAPPADLPNREPLITSKTEAWFRIHPIDNDPLFFGKSRDNRFDAPDGSYGVLYLAADPHCAFIETFGQSTGINVVSVTSLAASGLARIHTSRPLKLIDFAGTGGLARIGADARLCSGEHSMAQLWSKALYEHPVRADGLCYPARHDPARHACAIYNRAEDALTAEKLGSLAGSEHVNLLSQILDTYGFALL
jgi:hypothetical protein